MFNPHPSVYQKLVNMTDAQIRKYLKNFMKTNRYESNWISKSEQNHIIHEVHKLQKLMAV